MLGEIISRLEDPRVAEGLLNALDDPPLVRRLSAAAGDEGQSVTDALALAIRRFIDTATDDIWTQLIGILGRAEDPGLAAMHFMLQWAFPHREPTA